MQVEHTTNYLSQVIIFIDFDLQNLTFRCLLFEINALNPKSLLKTGNNVIRPTLF